MTENKITLKDPTNLSANVTADPTLHYTDGDVAIANVRVAIDHEVKEDGKWVDGPTQYVTVEVWRSLGVNAAATLKKGDPIIVTGRWKVGQYENNEGETVLDVRLVATHIAPNLRLASWPVRSAHAPAQTREPEPHPAQSPSPLPAQAAIQPGLDVG